MDSILDKFTYSKYQGEHHFPYYNYLGPHTNLRARMDDNYNPKQINSQLINLIQLPLDMTLHMIKLKKNI